MQKSNSLVNYFEVSDMIARQVVIIKTSRSMREQIIIKDSTGYRLSARWILELIHAIPDVTERHSIFESLESKATCCIGGTPMPSIHVEKYASDRMHRSHLSERSRHRKNMIVIGFEKEPCHCAPRASLKSDIKLPSMRQRRKRWTGERLVFPCACLR